MAAPQQQQQQGLDYYRSLGGDLAQDFSNFDDRSNFEWFEKCAIEPHRENFVVDYGDDEAWCAFDLQTEGLERLLKSMRPPSLNMRWINIWKPHKQPELLKALAKQYDFTPRLLGIMQSKPTPYHPKTPPASKPSSKQSSSLFHKNRHSPPASTGSNSTEGSQTLPPSTHTTDLSKLENEIQLTEISQPVERNPLKAINHWTMVNEVWHWSSVDFGRKYICLGYNSLHDLRMAAIKPEEQDRSPDMPYGKRVWTWLLLCDDKTVISINEDPYPFCSTLTDKQVKANVTIRHNLLNVFRQLSKAHDASKDSALAQLPIRRSARMAESIEEAAHRPMDAPGLLFYSLFDDWQTSYSLVVRRYHKYSEDLDILRAEMLTTAKLEHIDHLHRVGRQLAVLKRLYQSYEQIIIRVLDRPEATAASLKNSRVMPHNEDVMNASMSAIAESQSMLDNFLSSASRVRFERLKDRIRLYALSEIQECLDQKESLVMMNFNLIAIKESYSVERLTRVTLLLAKVTILFMPVSLMTAYFSTQLQNVTFTLRSYWIAFAAILVASVLGLVGFGLYTGTMEGQMLYRPLTRRFLEMVGRRRKERSERGDGSGSDSNRSEKSW